MERAPPPLTYDPNLRRDTLLALKLKERIRREGPIPVSDYMHACLHDPEHGYYIRRPAIGSPGDFITAPEISQIFGELIGLWCAVAWQQMGSPAAFALLELGPGRGTLMSDALRATRGVPGFHAAMRLVLHESNVALMAEQRARLASALPTWIARLDELPAGPVIIIANEFLDTCPVAQFEFDESHFYFRGVGLDVHEKLQFVRTGRPMLFADNLYETCPELHPGCTNQNQNFSFMLEVRRRIGSSPCAMLFADYGSFEHLAGDTLQAVRKHIFEHPLTSPGEADLTVQVHFSDFRHYVECDLDGSKSALSVDGPVTQAEFLGRLGIVERASRLMSANPEKAHAIEAGVARLIAPTGMGSRFKVIGVRSSHLPVLPGFA